MSDIAGQVIMPLEHWSAMKVSRPQGPGGPRLGTPSHRRTIKKQNREGGCLSLLSYEISCYKMTCSHRARLAKRDGFEISPLCMSTCLKDDGFLCVHRKQCSANIRRVLTSDGVLISLHKCVLWLSFGPTRLSQVLGCLMPQHTHLSIQLWAVEQMHTKSKGFLSS